MKGQRSVALALGGRYLISKKTMCWKFGKSIKSTTSSKIKNHSLVACYHCKKYNPSTGTKYHQYFGSSLEAGVNLLKRKEIEYLTKLQIRSYSTNNLYSDTFLFDAETFATNLRIYFEDPPLELHEEESDAPVEHHQLPNEEAHDNDIVSLTISDIMPYQPHEFFTQKLRYYIDHSLEKIKSQPVGVKNADAFAFFINGGKGVGKTRNTIETVEEMTLEYGDRFSKLMYLYAPFLNMCPLAEEEEMFGREELLNFQKSKKLITARMIYSYFTQSIDSSEVRSYRDFLEHCYHFIPDNISHVSEIIKYDLDLDNDESLGLFIVMDDCDELLRVKFENVITHTPYSLLLRMYNELPGVFTDRQNTTFIPIMVGKDIEGMTQDWIHKLGPTRPTYSGSSYQKNETFTVCQFPLLNQDQVENIVDNMFDRKGQIPIEDEEGTGQFIDKENWRDCKSFLTALAMIGGHPLALEHFLLFIASVQYLHRDFFNFQYAVEKTKYELRKTYDLTELGLKCTDNQIEKIIISLLSDRQILEVTGYKNYEFTNFYTFMNSGIIFPVIKPEEDEVIEYNNFYNLERVVNVPFIFLDELIEQIPEESKSKEIFRNLATALKNLLDLQLLEEPIPRKQIKIINTKYYDAMKEVKRRVRKPPETDIIPVFWRNVPAETPEFYSSYVRHLLSCYFHNWKVVLDKNLK
ncbi:predicted protein [Naegleria gruberi]|uniref:Predicted protein n=1 Tax=Naegleria gruberi TaxID=5762 RepID=D2UZW6_NAEGR|nr:uncharacterized protein NAEGRDRAFT_45569 [Naegleria gruberi]EFC50003.1 predicted protein [Naegleria gruberi]|eukprot:XP_002682747.1 predicted protein [Naegleria gruberi strain NEG-M]